MKTTTEKKKKMTVMITKIIMGLLSSLRFLERSPPSNTFLGKAVINLNTEPGGRWPATNS